MVVRQLLNWDRAAGAYAHQLGLRIYFDDLASVKSSMGTGGTDRRADVLRF